MVHPMAEQLLGPSFRLTQVLTDTTAADTQVLKDQTYYSYSNGALVLRSGTMTNRGAWNSTINAGASVTIPAGYHSGSGKVTANHVTNFIYATQACNSGDKHLGLNSEYVGSYDGRSFTLSKACNIYINVIIEEQGENYNTCVYFKNTLRLQSQGHDKNKSVVIQESANAGDRFYITFNSAYTQRVFVLATCYT